MLLDTGSGDILAAASAAAHSPVAHADWREVRDFDRVDPARSPLRQAAFQHDGGAERSPGSTFKIVSALGLELAAQRDPRLDALLGGMPLAGINALAAARGYAFRTDAPAYPNSGSGARITNFRDGILDRRAQDGKLGLAQALTYSLNTWFAWAAELSDASLLGQAQGGVPSLRALDDNALAGVRPIADMARRLGFERALTLDGGLLPPGYDWRGWDALQASVAAIDPIGSRHELRQMAIGLRMQATPLHMAMAAGAVGEGRAVNPRLLLALDGRKAQPEAGAPLGVRLDRIRAGLHGVVAGGTAASAFRGAEFERLRAGLFGKTGTAPVGDDGQATRLVHRVSRAGQHSRPDAAPGVCGVRQPLGRDRRRACGPGRGQPAAHDASKATNRHGTEPLQRALILCFRGMIYKIRYLADTPSDKRKVCVCREPGIRSLGGSRCANCSASARSMCSAAATWTQLLAQDDALGVYVELLAESLHAASRSARAQAAGNSYGDSVVELALLLVYELAARPGDFDAFRTALPPAACTRRGAAAQEGQRHVRPPARQGRRRQLPGRLRTSLQPEPHLCLPHARYRVWRDQRACSPAGANTAPRSAPSSGVPLDSALPIEVRQLASIAGCRPEWILRWSETLERFTGSPGPLHTRSKRFDSLKGNADKIRRDAAARSANTRPCRQTATATGCRTLTPRPPGSRITGACSTNRTPPARRDRT